MNRPPSSSFQELILALQRYWAEQGCLLLQPYDLEVGAGTFHPATTLRALGPEPWRAADVQPSRRPTDGRYGENPNRLYQHHQFQVILKPNPPDVQEVYLGSLRAIGIDPLAHDIRFVEDDWESPTLGAWGLGWEVWCDGMEITQYTYFQQAGGFEVRPVAAELTYGLERIAMYLQDVENVFDVEWVKWVQYRGVGKTRITPLESAVLGTDGRPTLTEGKSSTRVTFDRPGTYTLRAYAMDGDAYFSTQDVTVTVAP